MKRATIILTCLAIIMVGMSLRDPAGTQASGWFAYSAKTPLTP